MCQWVVGVQCQAVWSEDGQLYPAKVVSLDGQRCRVRFSGYENEQEVELSALKSPDAALQTLQNCEVTLAFTHIIYCRHSSHDRHTAYSCSSQV